MESVKVKLQTPVVWNGKRRDKGEVLEVPSDVAALNDFMKVIEDGDKKADKNSDTGDK